MQNEPEQWAVELWRKACHDYGGMSIEGAWGEREASLAIQESFAEREARLREVIAGMLGDLENIEESAALTKHRTLAALNDRTHG